MAVSLVEEDEGKRYTEKDNKRYKNPLKNHYNQIVRFAWILLITGEANKTLREWVGIDPPTELILLLMTKHAVPAREKETETDTFQIGALCFGFP